MRHERHETRDQRPETKERATEKECHALLSPVSRLLSQRGFTLVELMLVVVIIGVLAAMVVPRLAGRTEQAKIARAVADIAVIGNALDLYELDTGSYPDSLDQLVAREAPSNLSESVRAKWGGPYLRKGLPDDPWGRPYTYKKESRNNLDYDLLSLGSDGQPGKDDITN